MMDTYAGQQTTRFDSYPWEPRPRSFISKLKLDTVVIPGENFDGFQGYYAYMQEAPGEEKKIQEERLRQKPSAW